MLPTQRLVINGLQKETYCESDHCTYGSSTILNSILFVDHFCTCTIHVGDFPLVLILQSLCLYPCFQAAASDRKSKIKVFSEICRHFVPVFHHFFMEKFPSPPQWFEGGSRTPGVWQPRPSVSHTLYTLYYIYYCTLLLLLIPGAPG